MRFKLSLAIVSVCLPTVLTAVSASAEGEPPADELQSSVDLLALNPESLSLEDLIATYPGQVRSVAQAFGISEQDAARGLQMQEAAGRLRDLLDSEVVGFGGLWLDWQASAGPQVVVAVSRAAASRQGGAAGEIEATAATELAWTRLPGRVTDVPYSVEELRDAAKKLEVALARLSTPEDLAVVVDELENGLLILSPRGRQPEVAQATSVAGIPPDMISRYEDRSGSPDATLGGGSRVNIGGKICTTNFTYVRPNGTRALGTAGHCEDGSPSPIVSGVTLGSAVDGVTRTGGSQEGIDRQYHTVPSGHSTKNTVSPSNVAVLSGAAGRLPAGAAINFYGGNGVFHCGRDNIETLQLTGYMSNGQMLYRAPEGSPLDAYGGRQPVNGDSGAPLFILNRAIGIHEGGSDANFNDPLSIACGETGFGEGISITRNITDVSGVDSTSFFVQTGTGTNFEEVGTFRPSNPTRVYDSRLTGGALCGSGATRNISLDAQTLPDVEAVAVNITLIPQSGSAFMRAYPALENSIYDSAYAATTMWYSYPSAPAATSGVYRIGDFDKIRLRQHSGSGCTHVVVDFTGYFVGADGTYNTGAGKVYQPFSGPNRVKDTRGTPDPLGPGEVDDVLVRGIGNVPSDAYAVAVHVTAFRPTVKTFLSSYPGDVSYPGTSTVNADVNEIVSNLAFVRLDSSGEIRVRNDVGTTDYFVDVVGYFREGNNATNDGRAVFSGSFGAGVASIPAGATVSFFSGQYASVAPATGLRAALVSIRTDNANGDGWLVIHEHASPSGTGSNINFAAGKLRSSGVIAPVSSNGAFHITNPSTKSVTVSVDVTGWLLD